MDKMKKWKIGYLVACFIVVAFFMVTGCLIYAFMNDTKEPNSIIKLSSSVGDHVGKGREFELFAVLKTDDGDIIENEDFLFTIGEDAALKILEADDENATEYLGKSCKLQALEQLGEQKITVQCSQKSNINPVIFSIRVTSLDTYEIVFHYPNEENVNQEDTKTIEATFGERVPNAPSPSFGVHSYKWVIEGTDEEFDPADDFLWHTDVSVVAKFDTVKINFLDPLFDRSFTSKNVRLGETYSNDPWYRLQDNKGEWHFEGWYPDLNKEELKNGLQDGKFSSTSDTLYAKWSSEIKFEVPDIKPTNKGTITGTTLCSAKVVYGAKFEAPLATDLEYANQGKHEGWFNKRNGDGTLLNFEQYTGTGNATYYNCVSFPILLDSQDGKTRAPLRQIYGQSLSFTNTKLTDIAAENVLPLPDSEYQGWSFTDKWTWTNGGDDVYNAESPYRDSIKTGTAKLYAQRSSDYYFYTEIDGNGAPLTQAKKESKTVIYHSEVNSEINAANFASLTGGEWNFDGWHIFDGNCNAVFSDNPITGVCSEASLSLRAKWSSNITFGVPDIKPTNKGTITSEALCTAKVVYGAQFEAPLATDLEYANQGKHEGWFSDKNGSGLLLNFEQYMGAANATYYNCVSFPILLDSQDGKTRASLRQIYGQSLSSTNKILTDIAAENVLPSPDVEYQGWRFTDKWTWTRGGDDGYDVQSSYDRIKSGAEKLYAQRVSEYDFYTEIDENGAPLAQAKKESKSVIYHSEVNSEINAANFAPLTGGEWGFDGWHIFDGNCNSVFSDNPITGACLEASLSLRAKWSSEIKFEVPLAEGATESLGSPKINGNAANKIGVVYGGTINELPQVDYTYPGGLTDVIWHTDKFGLGDPIASLLRDGRYVGKANQTFYNKTEIAITFCDDLTGASAARSVTYGAEFNGEFPRFHGTRSADTRGWQQESNWQIENLGEQTESFIETFKFNLNRAVKCYAIWNVSVNYRTDIGNIKSDLENSVNTFRYGESLSLTEPTASGLWMFGGWYTDADYSGRAITRLLTNSEEFLSLVQNNSQLVDGRYCVVLYAKWAIDELPLNYGNYFNASEKGYPTSVSVVYGKSVASLPSVKTEDVPAGFEMAQDRWYDGPDFMKSVTSDDYGDYPLNLQALYYKFNPKTYTVRLNHNEGTATVTNTYNQPIQVKSGEYLEAKQSYIPQKGADKFRGYYYGNTPYYDNHMIGCGPWEIFDQGSTITLTAKWGDFCTITLNQDGGNNPTTGVLVVPYNSQYADTKGTEIIERGYGDKMPTNVTAPRRAGYTFNGYWTQPGGKGTQYYDSGMRLVKNHEYWKEGDSYTKQATLYAHWTINPLTASMTNTSPTLNDKGATTTCTMTAGNGSGTYRYRIASQSHPNLEVTINGGTVTLKTKANENNGGTVTVLAEDGRTGATIPKNIVYTTKYIKPPPSCFVAGTLITVEGGVQKRVEELKLGDKILTYNHFEGKYEYAPITILFAKEVIDYPILNLTFSNGTSLKIVNMHGLFDCDLNKYVMLDYDNASQFVGHSFVSVNTVGDHFASTKTKLVSVSISYQTTMRYTLVSARNINHVANGLLAVSDETEGLYNLFTYGENMTYSQAEIAEDIRKYGLTDYSEWSEYVTYEEFVAFGGEYMNIAFAKNLTTKETIIELIFTYVYDYGRL